MDELLFIFLFYALYLVAKTLSNLLDLFSRKELPVIEPPYISKKQFENRIEYYDRFGLRHRLDGAAIEFNSGVRVYYIHGQRIGLREFYNKWIQFKTKDT
jgi:hypothetical protein